jgi:phosphatidylserine/phosphatidylglycerophosphate/cardiolipin synthase-like enzyme
MLKRQPRSTGTGWGRTLPIVAVFVVLAVFAFQSRHKAPVITSQVPVPAGTAAWEVYFSPSGGCTDAIVDALAGAKRTVLVQAYSFTSRPIAEALIDAKGRGVAVQVILDRSNLTAHSSADDDLFGSNIPTFIDSAHAIAHNKVMVIDDETVITGSFNFTRAAEERNAENLLILRSRDLAKRYTDNWQTHKDHSEAYER